MTIRLNLSPTFTRWLLTIALCAPLAVLLCWRLLPTDAQANENADYQTYYEPVARNLLAGKGLADRLGGPAFFYPPGYSLLLAAAFRLGAALGVTTDAAPAGLTLLAHLLAALFLWLLAREVWSERTAGLAALAWISYPPILWLCKQPNSELPFMAVLHASVWLLARACFRQRIWLGLPAGLLAGAAALIRPIGLGASVMMGAGLLLAAASLQRRFRANLLALLLLGNAAALAPWQAWVHARTGRLVIVSSNLMPGIRDGLRFAVNLKRYRQAVAVPDDVRALMQRLDARAPELTSLPRLAAILAGEAPAPIAKLLALKAARSWYATDSGRREGALLALQAIYLCLIGWSGWRAWRIGGRARALAAGLGLTLLYFWGMTTLMLSILRYLTPAIGLLFALLPGGLRGASVR